MKNYTSLHTHTDLSFLDSVTNFKEVVDRAVELGMNAIAFTEHGNITQWVEKKMYCEKKGIKYIHGTEIYLTEKLEPKVRDNYHTILLAKNYEGVREINSLMELASREDHRYYKDRISFEEFLSLSDNVIKISACMKSPLRYIKEDSEHYEAMWMHYDFYEVQSHSTTDFSQENFNQLLYRNALKNNKRLVATNDVHYITPYGGECRTILQVAKGIEFDDEDKFNLSLLTYDELVDAFAKQHALPHEVFLQAIENSNIIADMVEDFELDLSPKYLKLYDDDEKAYKKRIHDMYMDKVKRGIVPLSKEYVEQIKEEIRVLSKLNMMGFMLFMSELVSWCWENGIPTGNCRGCFTKDALITTKNGIKNINEVNIGDYVISDDGNFNKVLNTFHYNIDEPMIKIEHELQGSIKSVNPSICTLDHKILINRNGVIDYIESKNIIQSDYVCIPKIKNNLKHSIVYDLSKYSNKYTYDESYVYEGVNTNKEYKYSNRWFQRNNICSRNTVINAVKNGKSDYFNNILLKHTPFNNINEYIEYCNKNSTIKRRIPRFVVMDYDFNMFVGLLYGDGFTNRNTNHIGLGINNMTEKDKKNKDVFYKIADKLNLEVLEIKSKHKNLTQLYICSEVVQNWIKTEFFNSKKGVDKTFNEDLFNQNKTSLKGLYDGLLLSDGHFGEYRTCFDNTSTSLINAFYILNNMLNNKPTSLIYRNGGIDSRGYTNKKSYKLSIGSYKKKILLENENYWFSKITNISKISKSNFDVYDLEVENNHSFVLNNMIVHNSVGGSLVAYVTDIIDVDPIKWNLVFSRFANEDRVELGDIDVDFAPNQRDLVYNYIINRVGEENSAYISTVGTVAQRGAIDEIGRALHRIWIKDNPNEKEELSPYSLSILEKVKEDFMNYPDKTRAERPDIFYYYDGIVGTAISKGIHPAGMVASNNPLSSDYGTYWQDGKRVLCINMEEVHEVSLIKYDILALNNIQIIRDACRLANVPYPKSHEINWNDDAVWNDMVTSPTGIFQFSGDYAFDCLKRFAPYKINDMSLVNAALRPSGATYRDDLFSGKVNLNPSKIIDELLADNKGYLVFQEDTIKFLKDICGLSGSDADNIRRAIGRKQRDRLEKAMPQILEGYCSKSSSPREVAEEEAKAFLQIIEDSANYQFGLNHSTGYSMVGYLCAYYRYYYPIEFVTSYLNNVNTMDDIKSGIELAKLKNINIKDIRFGYSTDKYTFDKETNTIYKGIASIKFCNAKMALELKELASKRKFKNFLDVIKAVTEETSVDTRQMNILIILGFFKDFGENKYLLDLFEMYQKLTGRLQIAKNKLEELGLTEKLMEKYSGKQTEKLYKEIDIDGIIKELAKDIPNRPLGVKIQMKYEMEFLEYVVYKNENISEHYYFVMDFKTYKNKSTPYLTLYRVKDGEQVKTKITKGSMFEEEPFALYSVLGNVEFRESNKRKFIDGKFVETDETELIINRYDVLA